MPPSLPPPPSLCHGGGGGAELLPSASSRRSHRGGGGTDLLLGMSSPAWRQRGTPRLKLASSPSGLSLSRPKSLSSLTGSSSPRRGHGRPPRRRGRGGPPWRHGPGGPPGGAAVADLLGSAFISTQLNLNSSPPRAAPPLWAPVSTPRTAAATTWTSAASSAMAPRPRCPSSLPTASTPALAAVRAGGAACAHYL
ncbi:hypothetical protein PVAP13_8KG307800 [Panicum virgatum]|uniref:Uncharacterized protein n=1 Tax=Panicum virgatum TaxID=38727 RepID=A0A8T0PPK6_PANVG|nr:hypothetical protein PVAP13_8KG307800 [Panicum virgatum]